MFSFIWLYRSFFISQLFLWLMLRNIPCNFCFVFVKVKFWWNLVCNLSEQINYGSFSWPEQMLNSTFFSTKKTKKQRLFQTSWPYIHTYIQYTSLYHALLSKTTSEKQHADKTSMNTFWWRFWGGRLASMGQPARVPAKLPPHYTSEQHGRCFWPRKCKDVLYLMWLKAPVNQHFWVSLCETFPVHSQCKSLCQIKGITSPRIQIV